MIERMEQVEKKLQETSARREFLGQIGKAAITAPAVALLLTASAQPAAAQYRPRRRRPRRR